MIIRPQDQWWHFIIIYILVEVPSDTTSLDLPGMMFECRLRIDYQPLTSVNQMAVHNILPFGLLQVQNDTNTRRADANYL